MSTNMDDLVKQVQTLTDATTDLLDATNISKQALDKAEQTSVAAAESASQDSASAKGDALRAESAAERADEIAGLETVRDALREAAVPFPDFWLPLNDSLQILAGEGTHDQIDVSAAQDGSVMVDLPTKSAEYSCSSERTYINKAGALKKATIDTPRFGVKGFFVEGSNSTNLALKSDVGDWPTPYSRYTVTKESGSTPFGVGDRLKYVSDTRSSSARLCYPIGTGLVPIAGYYTASIWMHKSNEVKGLTISGKKLTAVYGDRTPVETAGEWERYSVTANVPADADNINIYPLGTITAGRENFYFGLQFEQMPLATSYNPTLDNPVTRAADFLRISSNPMINIIPCTISIVWSGRGLFNYDSNVWTSSSGKSTGRPGFRNYIDPNSGDYSATIVANNIDGNQISAGVNRDAIKKDFNKTVVVFTEAEVITYMNGVKQTTNGRSKNSNDSTIYFGKAFFGYLKDFKIWHQALSDEQVAAL